MTTSKHGDTRFLLISRSSSNPARELRDNLYGRQCEPEYRDSYIPMQRIYDYRVQPTIPYLLIADPGERDVTRTNFGYSLWASIPEIRVSGRSR